MTRVINNKMELNVNSAVFGSFTLYSAGIVNVFHCPGPSGCFFDTDGSGSTGCLFQLTNSINI
jgi:hypothetical protein